jgi:hypothetical protein
LNLNVMNNKEEFSFHKVETCIVETLWLLLLLLDEAHHVLLLLLLSIECRWSEAWNLRLLLHVWISLIASKLSPTHEAHLTAKSSYRLLLHTSKTSGSSSHHRTWIAAHLLLLLRDTSHHWIRIKSCNIGNKTTLVC